MAEEVVEEQPAEAAAPRPRRRRRTKAEMEAARAAELAEGAKEEPAKPRRRRARAEKVETGDQKPADEHVADAGQTSLPLEEASNQDKRRASRRSRKPVSEEGDLPVPKSTASDIDAMTRMTQAATIASSEPMGAPAATLAEADQRAAESSEASVRQRSHGGSALGGTPVTNGRKRAKQNRRNRRQETPAGPSLTVEELEAMRVAELRVKATELGVETAGVLKRDLVARVYEAAARAEGFKPVEGVLDFQSEGYAIVRTGNYMRGDDDAFVHQQLIRGYGLRPGDWIRGSVGPARSGNKFPPLQRIESVNGHAPEELRSRPRFRDLTPIFPDERLVMEHGKDSTTGRAIDLVAPIGKGQRGLIVSPPKAGKTTVLKRICQSIAANNPEVHLFCLLVDERPEEVTDMERSIKGHVVASTFDMPADNHTTVAELVIEHAKRLVEEGEDVVVVLDSITRLARAYNLAAPASGRILSGGVDSAALYPPKKFLGAARNIEHGGSLTILASALVDTGSKMDEVIFEEFKGTGNMELKLDRDLANKRVFPAIDPVSSGTRNEDLLITAELQPFVWGIRRVLANMNNTERAAKALVDGLKATATNEEFLIRSAKKAQQQEFVA